MVAVPVTALSARARIGRSAIAPICCRRYATVPHVTTPTCGHAAVVHCMPCTFYCPSFGSNEYGGGGWNARLAAFW